MISIYIAPVQNQNSRYRARDKQRAKIIFQDINVSKSIQMTIENAKLKDLFRRRRAPNHNRATASVASWKNFTRDPFVMLVVRQAVETIKIKRFSSVQMIMSQAA